MTGAAFSAVGSVMQTSESMKTVSGEEDPRAFSRQHGSTRLLSHTTDTDTIDRVREGLRSHDPVIRAESVDALALLNDALGLVSALGSFDPYLRERAAKALALLGGPQITWRLVRHGWDAVPRVRCAVAHSLGQRGGWVARWMLSHLTTDADALVRYAALCALAQVDTRRARLRLRAAQTQDEHPWIRDAAAALLRRCETTSVRR